jgi:hypothetical protein
MVEGLFEKMEVADEGECRWARRQSPFVGIRENKIYSCKESSGEENGLKIKGKHFEMTIGEQLVYYG